MNIFLTRIEQIPAGKSRILIEKHVESSDLYNKMGSAMAKMSELLWGTEETIVLMVGLPGAGKTSALYKYQTGVIRPTKPTTQMNAETIQVLEGKLHCWDIGGRGGVHEWLNHVENIRNIMFFIDSSDENKLIEVNKWLVALSGIPHIKQTNVAIMLHKRDCARNDCNAFRAKLNLEQVKAKNLQTIESSSITGAGLREGFSFIVQVIQNPKSS